MSYSIEHLQANQKLGKENSLLVKESFSKEAVIARFESLKPREKEVARLLVGGLLSKDVAAQLCISPATVKVHKSRMMTKMQVGSLQELVIAFVKSGLV